MKMTINFEMSNESAEKSGVYRRDRASNTRYPADTHVGSQRRMSPVRETALTLFK